MSRAGPAPTRRVACREGRFRDSCHAMRVPFRTVSLNPPMIMPPVSLIRCVRWVWPAARGRARSACREGNFPAAGRCPEGHLQVVQRPEGPLHGIGHGSKAPLARLRTRRVRAGAARPAPAQRARSATTHRAGENKRQEHRWIEAQRHEGSPRDIGPCPENAPRPPSTPREASTLCEASILRGPGAQHPSRSGLRPPGSVGGQTPGKSIGGFRFSVLKGPLKTSGRPSDSTRCAALSSYCGNRVVGVVVRPAGAGK